MKFQQVSSARLEERAHIDTPVSYRTSMLVAYFTSHPSTKTTWQPKSRETWESLRPEALINKLANKGLPWFSLRHYTEFTQLTIAVLCFEGTVV